MHERRTISALAGSPDPSIRSALEGDIKGCFDNISHKWLIDNIPTDKRILGRWLRSGFIYKKKLFSTEAGTPQGGIISPMIANMALDGLEATRESDKAFESGHTGLGQLLLTCGDSLTSITGYSRC